MRHPNTDKFVDDLKGVLVLFPDYRFAPAPGASDAQLAAMELEIDIRFDETLKALWAFSNGSKRDSWLGVHTDEDTPCSFLSLEQALKLWKDWNALGEKWGKHGMPDQKTRDRRIQPDWQAKWFPFGEFNGGSTQILFDSVPSAFGTYGQVIAYQHDPDAVYYICESVAVFLKQSPPILQKCLQALQDIE